MSYTDKTFLDVLKPYVLEDMKKTRILASLTASQAFLESNKGNSGLTTKANNLFGIKGKYNGQSVTMKTTEYINGKAVKVDAEFRKYPSWLESVADHSRLLSTKRYSKIPGVTNYKLACQYVEDAGYATAEDGNGNKTYAKSLIKNIEKYQLYLWDAEVLSELVSIPVQYQWTIGQTYSTHQDLYIRETPNGDKKSWDDITNDAKAHGFKDDFGKAILNSGTRVTIKDIKETKTAIWLQIPSGWICGKNSKITYVY